MNRFDFVDYIPIERPKVIAEDPIKYVGYSSTGGFDDEYNFKVNGESITLCQPVTVAPSFIPDILNQPVAVWVRDRNELESPIAKLDVNAIHLLIVDLVKHIPEGRFTEDLRLNHYLASSIIHQGFK